MLLTWHNLTFYQDLMSALRRAVENGDITAFVGRFSAAYGLKKRGG
jgi:tRNA-guanine family transglycosylase